MAQVVATTSTGTGEKMMMLGNENHRVAMLGCVSGVHTLTMAIAATRTSVTGGASALSRCARAAEQGIGHDEADACEETEWTQPIKTAAVVGGPSHLEAVDEGAQRDALRERRDVGAPGEGLVPERPGRFVRLEAEFESDAAPDQARQHQEDWNVERAEQHGISKRKCRHQRGSSQNQPGLVAIPDRRDRVHQGVSIAPVADERKEDADSEVETVHHHIHHQSKADDHGPDDGKIDAHRRYLLLPPGKSISGSR